MAPKVIVAVRRQILTDYTDLALLSFVPEMKIGPWLEETNDAHRQKWKSRRN